MQGSLRIMSSNFGITSSVWYRFALKSMNYAFKLMDFVVNMMDFVVKLLI